MSLEGFSANIWWFPHLDSEHCAELSRNYWVSRRAAEHIQLETDVRANNVRGGTRLNTPRRLQLPLPLTSRLYHFCYQTSAVVSSRSTAAHRGCSISRAANAYYQCTALIVLLTLIFCCCWKRPEVFSRVFFDQLLIWPSTFRRSLKVQKSAILYGKVWIWNCCLSEKNNSVLK